MLFIRVIRCANKNKPQPANIISSATKTNQSAYFFLQCKEEEEEAEKKQNMRGNLKWYNVIIAVYTEQMCICTTDSAVQQQQQKSHGK